MKKLFLGLIFSILLTVTIAFAAGGRANQMTLSALYPVAVVTEDGLSSAIDLKAYEGPIAVVVNVAATGSSQKTVALKMQHALTSGGTYNDVTGGGFTTVADTASSQIIYLNKDTLRRYVKLNIDVTTGDTISVPLAASILGFKKYQP